MSMLLGVESVNIVSTTVHAFHSVTQLTLRRSRDSFYFKDSRGLSISHARKHEQAEY